MRIEMKRGIAFLLCLAMVASVFVGLPTIVVTADAANTAIGSFADLSNGGFESVNTSPYWTMSDKAQVTIEEGAGRNGSNALHIEDITTSTGGNRGFNAISDKFSVIPGNMYTLSGYMKGDGTIKGNFHIVWLGADGVTQVGLEQFNDKLSTTEWVYYTFSKVAPADAAYAQIRLSTGLVTKGNVYYDDITFTASNLIPANMGSGIGSKWRTQNIKNSFTVAYNAASDTTTITSNGNRSGYGDDWAPINRNANNNVSDTLPANTTYIVTFTVSGTQTTSGAEQGYFVVKDMTNGNAEVSNKVYFGPGHGGDKEYSFQFTTNETAECKYRLFVYANKAYKGTYSISNITVKAKTDVAFNNGDFDAEPIMSDWTSNSSENVFLESGVGMAHSGNNALCIKDAIDYAGYNVQSAKFSAIPGQSYAATVYFKGDCSGQFYIAFYDADGNNIGQNGVIPAASSDWTLITNIFTAPSNAVTGAIILATSKTAVGTVCYDDVAVELICLHTNEADFTVVEPATCYKTGIMTGTCSTCNQTDLVIEIPMLDHEWDDGTVITPASCSSVGVMRYTCKNKDDGCTAYHEKSIPLADHEPVFVAEKPATFDEDGYKEHYECKCGAWFKDAEGNSEITNKSLYIINKTGPDLENGDFESTDGNPHWTMSDNAQVTIEPGVGIDGSNGLHIEDITTPTGGNRGFNAISDKFSVTPGNSYTLSGYLKGNAKGNFHIVWLDENRTQVGLDQFNDKQATSEWVYYTFTKTAPANAVYAQIRLSTGLVTKGDVYYDNITVALNCSHTNEADFTVVEPATCYKTGTKTGTCSICKQTGLVIEIPMLDHEWDDGTVITPASCSATGVIRYTCKNDGCTVYHDEDIPLAKHAPVFVAAKPATEDKDGYKEHYECKCGAWFKDAEGNFEITDKSLYIINKTGGVVDDDTPKVDISNSSFESVVKNPYWTMSDKAQVTIEAGAGRNGSNALHIEDITTPTGGNRGFNAISDKISVTAGSTYTLSGYMKGTAKGNFHIVWLDASGTQIGLDQFNDKQATSEWVYYTFTKIAPENAVYAQVRLSTGLVTAGDVYFDDVTFTTSNLVPANMGSGIGSKWRTTKFKDAGFTMVYNADTDTITITSPGTGSGYVDDWAPINRNANNNVSDTLPANTTYIVTFTVSATQTTSGTEQGYFVIKDMTNGQAELGSVKFGPGFGGDKEYSFEFTTDAVAECKYRLFVYGNKAYKGTYSISNISVKAKTNTVLNNGDFETDVAMNGWTPNSSENVFVESGVDVGHSGFGALRITDTKDNAGYNAESARFPAIPGQSYTASVYFKGDCDGQLYLAFYDANGNRVGLKGVMPAASSDWTLVAVTYTAPSDAVTGAIILATGKATVGTAYFDDVSLQLNCMHTNEADFTVVEPATCYKTGTKTGTCSICNQTNLVIEIPMLDHQFNDGIVVSPASCGNAGVLRFVCKNDGCTAYHDEDIPLAEHDPVFVAAKPATADVDGCKAHYECECGTWFQDAEAYFEITDKSTYIISKTGAVEDDDTPDVNDSNNSDEPDPTGDAAVLLLMGVLMIASCGFIIATKVKFGYRR